MHGTGRAFLFTAPLYFYFKKLYYICSAKISNLILFAEVYMLINNIVIVLLIALLPRVMVLLSKKSIYSGNSRPCFPLLCRRIYL